MGTNNEANDLAPAPAVERVELFRGPALGVEVLSPAAAEVVRFTMGDTEVVMIFDEALDL